MNVATFTESSLVRAGQCAVPECYSTVPTPRTITITYSFSGFALNPQSKITGGPTVELFTANVLGRYEVRYFQCIETQFIQTADPFWLDEAYSNAITPIDLGVISRNIEKAELTSRIIANHLTSATRFLDFGGGYGIFSRLMRDWGYEFTHYDKYCSNLFAAGHAVDSLQLVDGRKYDLVTAWEVFEHVTDPKALLQELLAVADAVLFSTELLPDKAVARSDDWWYFMPETGQHVSFFSRNSLAELARRLNLFFFTDGTSNHIFSTTPLKCCPFTINRSLSDRIRNKLCSLARVSNNTPPRRASLLGADYEQALSVLRQKLNVIRNDR